MRMLRRGGKDWGVEGGVGRVWPVPLTCMHYSVVIVDILLRHIYGSVL